jgi:ribosomal protein S18 acetylase RimI-like enzyme
MKGKRQTGGIQRHPSFGIGVGAATYPFRPSFGRMGHSMAMLTYRTFRNADPPVLAAFWQSRLGQAGLTQPVSPDLLEQLVFAKLYFEQAGLFLAFDAGQLVGLAHAGFGPNEDQSWISTETGVTCVLVVRRDHAEAKEVAAALLQRSEAYLCSRGAKVLYGGAAMPRVPFYLGLYGGSESPGVLSSDAIVQQLYADRGYEAVEHTLLFRRELSGFESSIDRQQMQIRRQMIVEVTNDAPTHTWWEASTLGEFDLTQFDLLPRGGDSIIASALFRSMMPSVTNAMSQTTGLIRFHVVEGYRRRGVANFLLSEAFRQFIRQGILAVETQISRNDEAALATMRKLGFQQVEQGIVFRKRLSTPTP